MLPASCHRSSFPSREIFYHDEKLQSKAVYLRISTSITYGARRKRVNQIVFIYQVIPKVTMKYKFAIGEKVLCFEPDETKARVLYNAKVMDADILKDSKGKKKVEYKIHFQGWNHVWDRWADEAFVVRDDEENRKLQRKLARKAIKQLSLQKGKKRHHLPGVANKQVDGEGLLDEHYSSDDSSTESNSSSLQNLDKKSDQGDHFIPVKRMNLSGVDRQGQQYNLDDDQNTTVREELPSRRSVSLDIPAALLIRLDEDFTMIKKRDMLVNLPVCPNVVQILDNYIKKFGQQYVTLMDKQKFGVSSSQQCEPDMLLPPEKRLSLCQEVCSDVKLLFDFALPLTLLYLPERRQFKDLMKTLRFCQEIDGDDQSQFNETKNDDRGSHTSPAKSPPDKQSLPYSPISSNEPHQSNQLTKSQKPHPKKKTAEDLLIEETHKYLIPNQPNLDQTGLSQDAQGRRRSSRLSHHESTPAKSNDPKLAPETRAIKQDTKNHSVDITRTHDTVSVKSHIFLRVPTKKTCPSSNHNEGYTNMSANSQQPLYNANPCMDWETYILSCGSDAKTIKELKRIWNWSILPQSYKPEEGTLIPPSLVYGVHHLLRFFVKLPDIMVQMEIPEYKVRVIMKHLHGILKFLSDYERELFEIDHYIPCDTISSDE